MNYNTSEMATLSCPLMIVDALGGCSVLCTFALTLANKHPTELPMWPREGLLDY